MDEAAPVETAAMNAMRIIEEFREEARRRCEIKAKELGFSSWDEYKRHQTEQRRLNEEWYQNMLDEKCARLGKTRDELYAEDPQRDVSYRWSPHCDCKGRYAFLEFEQV